MTTTTDRGLDQAFAEARPEEPPGLLLAQARVQSALFGRAARIGRYDIIERLARGGMGVVYRAYDSELNRGVALKMVSAPEDGRDRALGEAQALARLSHPNVVPVFDVGTVEDHVYIVMELVRGPTLRERVKGKRRRDILAAYRQAGEGLAAAHLSGLVHRDFKPDNAIVGGDGRVRVVDFGLACEAADGEDSAPRRRGGTPRYMAPEQARGEVAAAADQYSFCAALAEALAGGDPEAAAPPRWLEVALSRGLADDPRRRFPSMAELLRALDRDPRRAWRRRIAGGGLAVVAVAAFLVGRARSTAEEPEPCSGGGGLIANSWARPARDAQLARLAGLSTYGRDLAPHLAERLTTYASRWERGHRDACVAHRRGLQSAALLDRRMACLERGRAALSTVAEVASTTGAGALPELARAVASLPEPEACADLEALGRDVEPPPPGAGPRVARLRDQLERSRVLLAAGRPDVASTTAHGASAELRSLGYRPLLAEALLVEGRALVALKAPGAIPMLVEATAVALEGNVDAIAIEAWARRAWWEGMTGRPEPALAGLEVIEALAKRTPSAQLARALLYNNVGSIQLALDRRAAARAWLERAAVAARPVTGPGAVELTAIRRNMALVIDDPGEADAHLAGVAAELARLLGPDHPDTLLTLHMRATTTLARLDEAMALLAGTCRGYELHDVLASELPACLGELGDLRRELGDVRGASAAFEHALARAGRPELELPELRGYVALWDGDVPRAIARFETALAERPPAAGEPWYRTYDRAKLWLGIGRALRTAGELPEARDYLARSEGALATIARDHPAVAIERRLGRARAELAQALAASRVEPAKRAALAGQAVEWFHRAGGPPDQTATLRQLSTGSP